MTDASCLTGASGISRWDGLRLDCGPTILKEFITLWHIGQRNFLRGQETAQAHPSIRQFKSRVSRFSLCIDDGWQITGCIMCTRFSLNWNCTQTALLHFLHYHPHSTIMTTPEWASARFHPLHTRQTSGSAGFLLTITWKIPWKSSNPPPTLSHFEAIPSITIF